MLPVLTAILGVPISAAYGFLALVSYLQKEIFTRLRTDSVSPPNTLGWLPETATTRGVCSRPCSRPKAGARPGARASVAD